MLLCSDGLWNYCSEASDLAALVAQQSQALGDAAPGEEVPVGPLATALVAWAVAAGGADNISVALARVE